MAKKRKIDLSFVRVEADDTDEILKAKAAAALPKVLREAGRYAAEQAWNGLTRTFRNSIIKTDQAERSKFIRETQEEFIRERSLQERELDALEIFAELKKARDAKSASQPPS